MCCPETGASWVIELFDTPRWSSREGSLSKFGSAHRLPKRRYSINHARVDANQLP